MLSRKLTFLLPFVISLLAVPIIQAQENQPVSFQTHEGKLNISIGGTRFATYSFNDAKIPALTSPTSFHPLEFRLPATIRRKKATRPITRTIKVSSSPSAI